MINSMIKNKNNTTKKPVSFLAPGQLAMNRAYGKKASNVSIGTKRISIVEERTTDGCLVHNLLLHFGDSTWVEKNIKGETLYMDLLTLCKKFIDIYSVGFKILDGDGKPLRNDKDVLAMMNEHEDVTNIHIHLEVDETLEPLTYKLPEDNPSFVPIPRDSEVRDAIIEDSNNSGPVDRNTNNIVQDSTQEVRKVRGPNKNKRICSMKAGEKLEIKFFNNRGVGPNRNDWSRHLGKIVKNRNLCPVQVLTWKEITDANKNHMWAAAKEYFSNPDMEAYREQTLEHMSTLWMSWRSNLNKKYVMSCKTDALALKNVPPQMNAEDWKWLCTNKFFTEEFKNKSSKCSDNRSKQAMHHRSGSKSHCQIIYEMEATTNTTPSVAEIFFATRQKKGKLVDPKEQDKYDEIVETVQNNASLSPIEVVETCFGRQNHSHVFGYGGGMKRKHFDDARDTQIKDLRLKLSEKEEESTDLRRRVQEIESWMAQMKNENQPSSNESQFCGGDLN